jgi:hypothetical protein
VVEVRSAEDILLTLDERGSLENLPFMPEMLQFCGQRFQVVKRADKTCIPNGRTMRQVQNAVHLGEVRCDGSAHGGCEEGCSLYWKEEWLKPVVLSRRRSAEASRGGNVKFPNVSFGTWNTIDDLHRNTMRVRRQGKGSGEVFYCQATATPEFGKVLPWWDARQYVRDVKSGNVGPIELISELITEVARKIRFSFFERRTPPNAQATQSPASSPAFGPGDVVEIRSLAEIEATLDRRGRNQGLSFTPEMRELCGRSFRVLKRIHRIIDERTGNMTRLVGGCLILEGAMCKGDRHRFCPRMAQFYWRDIWLRGVSVGAPATVTEISGARAPQIAKDVAASARRA